jgi:hypothetical protein
VTVERVRKLKDRRDVPFTQQAANCRVFFNRSELDAWMASMQRRARR